MQRTRLNTLFNQIVLKFRQWVFNPWRRLSLVLLSLLFGNFFATAISATAGQTAKLDVTISAFLVIGVELISWLYYRFTPRREQTNAITQQLTNTDAELPVGLETGPIRSRSTLAESLNAFKLGMIYGLFVEAFKLGS
ncbi:MAG: DUF565 domain-containing protein [Cyanobacteria bacterium P01_D01_bin.105]